VIAEVTTSGLRGRGGGGYPTGLKWSTVAKTPADRSTSSATPTRATPAPSWTARSWSPTPTGCSRAWPSPPTPSARTRATSTSAPSIPLAVERLKTAIRKAKRQGFLGHHICETQFNFDIEIRLGAGAFVCGEETALMASIEGGRGQPRPRPPYPAESGLWGTRR
jgi:bidirectional [NiFe] hydrogenase diaphorase subunit